MKTVFFLRYTQFVLMLIAFTVFYSCGSQKVKDIDGNIYKTVRIGDQVWMAENLKTTRYNDGNAIPHVTDDEQWADLYTGAYCWYDNDPKKGDFFGALYNWYAVNTGKLCPQGWRVPTDEDWTTLVDYLGGDGVAGGKLKATGTLEAGDGLWFNPNEGATNEKGFSALPGGERDSRGWFDYVGEYDSWWSDTEDDDNYAWGRYVGSDFGAVKRGYEDKRSGYSVRCRRDL